MLKVLLHLFISTSCFSFSIQRSIFAHHIGFDESSLSSRKTKSLQPIDWDFYSELNVPSHSQIQKAFDTIDSKSPSDSCTTDTTILLKNGSWFQINKCYFDEIKQCLRVNEYNTIGDLLHSHLRSTSDQGNVLQSGGMFEVTLCKDTCLKRPIQFYLKASACTRDEGMTLWTYSENMIWKNIESKAELVRIDGVEFYTIEIDRTGQFNCAKLVSTTHSIKIKLKDHLKADYALLSMSCPLFLTEGVISKKRNRICFSMIYPMDNIVVHLRVKDVKNNTTIIEEKPLNALIKNGVIPRKESSSSTKNETQLDSSIDQENKIYRKYVIHREQIRPLEIPKPKSKPKEPKWTKRGW